MKPDAVAGASQSNPAVAGEPRPVGEPGAPGGSAGSGHPHASHHPQRKLGLGACVALIVGVVIGAGIFKAPAMVAGMTGSVEWMFLAWALGGAISLAGALCYAELTTAYPSAGGDYHFLHRAYGRSLAFLFGWARVSVITTGSIALLAFVFGDYMQQALPLHGAGSNWGPVAYGASAVVLLSWINLRGIRTGMATQAWLTVAEVLGLLLLVGAAISLAAGNPVPVAVVGPAVATSPPLASFGLAMVFVLLTYGGWNEAAYISAEVRDGKRNMVRALTLSIVIITLLYLLVTWAYWRGLGMDGMAKSEALAADLMGRAFGPVGQTAIALLVAVSALTSINATLIVGARTSFAMGRDWPVLSLLGQWDTARGTPSNAMRVQCVATLALMAVGAATGSGFKSMVEFTAPVFWLFFLLSGLSLFVLRRRDPLLERPFRVPLYPFLPLLFCASSAYMLWSSLSYVYSQSLGGWNAAWIGVAVLLLGLLLLGLMRLSSNRKSNPEISP